MGNNVTELLRKEPFKRIRPKGSYAPSIITDTYMGMAGFDTPQYDVTSQSDFLREYFVSGHKINDPAWYPDKTSYDDSQRMKDINNGKAAWVTEKVARCAFPFQHIITIKQLAHLCGNKISFKDSNTNITDKLKNIMTDFKQGWLDENMEVAWWECVKSEKITGDCAIAFYIKGNRSGWKTLSFLKGDTLYPHYDLLTGKLSKFARQYNRLNEKGEYVNVVEVWDNKKAYRFEKDNSSTISKIKNSILDVFGLDGYTLIEDSLHGYNCVPVVYKRNMYGPCWSPSQDNVDMYELSISQLCENNKAYAFPILVLLGDDADIKGTTNGRPYAITSSNPETKVDLLSKGDAAQSFSIQLEVLLKNIFLGSFTVIPPEVRSGDLPGVAIKLIYSPALEKAMDDAMDWNLFVDEMVDLFKYGYGIKTGRPSDFNMIKVKGGINPYVHENTAELIQLLSQSAIAGILTEETAIDKNPFSTNDEYKRKLKEKLNETMVESAYPDGMNKTNLAREVAA